MSSVRVQILLSREDDDAIEAEARLLGISKSEVVRRCLRSLDRPQETGSHFEDLIGIIKDTGPGDMGRNHDEYLYGKAHR